MPGIVAFLAPYRGQWLPPELSAKGPKFASLKGVVRCEVGMRRGRGSWGPARVNPNVVSVLLIYISASYLSTLTSVLPLCLTAALGPVAPDLPCPLPPPTRLPPRGVPRLPRLHSLARTNGIPRTTSFQHAVPGYQARACLQGRQGVRVPAPARVRDHLARSGRGPATAPEPTGHALVRSIASSASKHSGIRTVSVKITRTHDVEPARARSRPANATGSDPHPAACPPRSAGRRPGVPPSELLQEAVRPGCRARRAHQEILTADRGPARRSGVWVASVGDCGGLYASARG